MALITLPTGGIKRIQWTLVQPAQVNRSEWTGAQKVMASGRGWWRADVELTPMREAEAWAWRKFLAQCQGPVNTFQLVASEGEQVAGLTVLVNGAGQTGSTLATDGWGANGTKLKAGQFVTVAGQLLQLTADVVSSGGAATLNFLPLLRSSPADNAGVSTSTPYATMALTGAETGWSVEPGKLYGMAFSCEERF